MIAFANELGWWAVPVLAAAGVGIYAWRKRGEGGGRGNPALHVPVEEARQALNRGERLVFADVRSESAYEGSATTISGAIRLHPARALEDAAAMGIEKEARILTFCA